MTTTLRFCESSTYCVCFRDMASAAAPAALRWVIDRFRFCRRLRLSAQPLFNLELQGRHAPVRGLDEEQLERRIRETLQAAWPVPQPLDDSKSNRCLSIHVQGHRGGALCSVLDRTL